MYSCFFSTTDSNSSIIIFQVKTFSNDMKAVEEPLMSHVALQSSAEQKNFYDLLHFSPLKVSLKKYINTPINHNTEFIE